MQGRPRVHEQRVARRSPEPVPWCPPPPAPLLNPCPPLCSCTSRLLRTAMLAVHSCARLPLACGSWEQRSSGTRLPAGEVEYFQRKHNAVQAYTEWMPIRWNFTATPSINTPQDYAINRTFEFGVLSRPQTGAWQLLRQLHSQGHTCYRPSVAAVPSAAALVTACCPGSAP